MKELKKEVSKWYNQYPLSVRFYSMFYKPKNRLGGQIVKFNFPSDLQLDCKIGTHLIDNENNKLYLWCYLGKSYFKLLNVSYVQ